MQPDPVRSPSFIPSEVEGAFEGAFLAAHPNTPPLVAARDALRSVAPELYAHWAEGRVEAVAKAISWRARRDQLDTASGATRELYEQDARAALGLEDRT